MHDHTLRGWGKNSNNILVTECSDFNYVPVPIRWFPGDNMDHRGGFIDGDQRF